MLELLKITGAMLGIVAFGWKLRDLLVAYLHIALDISQSGGNIFAKACVENKSLCRKQIDNALLLVGPERESPLETFNHVSEGNGWGITATSTNDIVAHRIEKRMVGSGGRQMIPLSFFYSENLKIADECLSYCAPINLEGVEAGIPYSVRFFVSGKRRLHRSTHNCFQL